MKPDPLNADTLVEAIAGLQSKGDDGYSEGLFPTQRGHPYLPYTVEDDTIFPTAVTVYTLQQVQAGLSEDSRDLVEAVTHKAVANYPRYLNNQGQMMYNFWQNVPEERFFPNSLLARFRNFHLPEDIDTTAYVYLTQPHARRDVRWLRERLLLDTNGHRRHIRNTLPSYRHLRAYSTWLGEANMPIDFDVCALTNLLLFIFRNDLPLNEHDHASIAFITAVLDNDDHLRHPFEVAPWYGNTAVILYHVARLAASCDVPEFAARRERIVRDLHTLADQSAAFMERLLASTSLMRLGQPPRITSYPDDLSPTLDRFHFFAGSILTPIDNPITWALARRPLFRVRYRCRAHALALLLEHLIFLSEWTKK